jgi:hypothetical protein
MDIHYHYFVREFVEDSSILLTFQHIVMDAETSSVSDMPLHAKKAAWLS